MKKRQLINLLTLVFAFISLTIFSGISACIDTSTAPSDTGETVQVNTSLSIQKISFKTVNNEIIDAILALPESIDAALPAVVVMHGSGGLWKNDDPAQGMSNQFLEWADILTDKQIIGLFIDSYAPRGIASFSGVHPPENAVAAAEFIRPHDAYAGLSWLRTLHSTENMKLVQDTQIGLLGFSHGGTAVIATLADVETMDKETWNQQYNGNSYPCPKPAQKPSTGGFSFGVAYYPGAFMYGYFGNPTNNTGIYVNYAPVTIIAAGQDPLYTSGHTEALVNRAEINGAGTNNNSINLIVYENAEHSFDGKTTGDDGNASSQARIVVNGILDTYF